MDRQPGADGRPLVPSGWNHGRGHCEGAVSVRQDGSGLFNPDYEPVIKRIWGGSSDSYWFL